MIPGYKPAATQPLSEIGELVSATLSGDSLWWDGPMTECDVGELTKGSYGHDDQYYFKMRIGEKVYLVAITECQS